MERGDVLAGQRLRLSRSEFEQKYNHLWLVRELDPTEAPPALDTKHQASTLRYIQVAKLAKGGNQLLAKLSVDPRAFGLYPIAKGAGRDPERVTVGRATNNDIVVWHETVSKAHAYFSRGDDGAWRLYDAGSTNGTVADGQVLGGGEGVAIHSGSAIVFGSLSCAVIGSGELYDSL